ncbi:hypothetical protein V1264_017368 [Littorina saxatilis]|uniref:Uncharacterized protein n=1 Tax=Littorina saxatilis TaxID=31220 RepID=A0AAN9GEI8_9CAEN
MSRQVSHICSTSFLEIRRVAKIRRFLTKKAATQLVCARVTPRIDYCNSLLAGISTDQLSRIQRVQNSAAKVILRKKRRDHVTPLLNHLHWLPVQQRIQYKLGTLAFNFFRGTLPPYLSSKLTKYSPTRSLRSSSQLLLTVPRTKLKSAGQRSFRFQVPTLWNSLPLAVRQSPSLPSFKIKLKTHLYKSAFY